jgi:hypothetical protein
MATAPGIEGARLRAISLARRFRKFILSIGAAASRAQYEQFLFSTFSF